VGGDGSPSQGDTLGYTVTITNPGSSATGAALADTLDPNTALVAGSVTISPVALNDFFTTASVAAPGVLANDIGTTQTIQGAGVPRPTSQGGSVTVEADGSFTYTPPATGSGTPDTFSYTITDGTYSDTGIVSVLLPDDAPTVVSTVPADLATGVAENSTITVNFSESVSATTASFTISCVDASANAVVIPYALSPSPSASFVLTPNLNVSTNDHLRVGDNCTVTVLAAQIHDTDLNDPPDTLAADYLFSFKVPPVAANDTFTPTAGAILPNVIINSAGSGFSVNANDTVGTATFNSTTLTSAAGGTVVLQGTGANMGQFTYDPPAGFAGADSFVYQLDSAGGNVTATVALVVAPSPVIWFVSNSPGSTCPGVPCDGRLTHPFTTLDAFRLVNNGVGLHPNDNHNIFVFGGGAAHNLPASLALRAGQRLIGQGTSTGLTLLIPGLTVPTGSVLPPVGGTAPSITANAGITPITLGMNNDLYGFTLGASTNATSITGNAFGTLRVKDVTISNTSRALSLTNGAFGVAPSLSGSAFLTITSSGGTQNIDLNAVGGVVNLGGGALSGATGPGAVRITNGTVAATYGGTITSSTNPVLVTGMTGGGATFNGLITGTGLGISLTTNGGGAGATFAFTGGLSLSTGANAAFTATGGGTVTATQNNTSIVNTLTTGSGIALNVANTTIGLAGLTFRSIASNGASSGIVLNTTGTTGALTVSGNGGAGTGGAIQNSTTDGVVLTSTASPNLNWMTITDSAGGAADDGIVMTNVTGSPTVSDCTITNSPHNGITVDNLNTNMTAFTLRNSTVQCASGQPCQPSGSIGNDGLLLQMRGSSVLTSGSVTNTTFSGLRATGIQVLTSDSGRIGSASGGAITAPAGSNSFTVTTSSFTNNNIAMDFSQSQVSSMAFRLLSNPVITGNDSHAINTFTATGSDTGPASHFHVGIIDGNVIGTAGTNDSGSRIGNGIRAVVQGQNTQGAITISNNTIREVANADIISLTGQNGSAVAGTNAARFKVVNNSMPAPSGSDEAFCGIPATPCAANGIFVLADEGTAVCTAITGNTIYDVTTANGSFDVYLAERAGPPAGAQLTVEGVGAATTFINANNTLAGANKSFDEGANVSTVSSCGVFP
jgi:hypothetical protein